MGMIDHGLRDGRVLGVGGRGLAVFLERAVDHHGGEAEGDGLFHGRKTVAVVEVQDDGERGVELDGSLHELLEVEHAGILEGPARGLDDDGTLGLGGGLHDGLDLLHVVDVVGPDAVAGFQGFVQDLLHGNERHCRLLWGTARIESGTSTPANA